MFYRFKPARRLSPVAQPVANARLAKLIFLKITAAQRGLAGALSRACSHLSAQTLKWCWLAAGISSVLMAGCLIYTGLTGRSYTLFLVKPAKVIPLEGVQVPAGLTKQLLLDLYLDSMQKAIIADSIRTLQTNSKNYGKSPQ
jgi:hypothetical protein